MPFAALVSLSCLTLVLNLLSFMTVAVVLPTLIAEWGLSSTEAGWLGGVFFAGYVIAVPILVSLTDRIAPKRIFTVCAGLGTLASLGFAVLADGLWSGLVLRFLTGAGVAGTYMPGLKALADALDEPERSRAASYYTSVFAVGSGISIWIGGETAALFGWRWAFVVAAGGSLLALLLGWAVLPTGKTASQAAAGAGAAARHALDFRPVFRNRAAMVNIVAYFGHTWEVFASRVWVVSFLVFTELGRGAERFFIDPVALATLVAFAGVPASMIVGEAASRLNRRRILLAVMAVSVAATASVGLAGGLGLGWVAALAILHGTTSYADTGTINAGTVAVAAPELRGATMAVHAFAGFLGGVAGPLAVGIALDAAGGVMRPAAWAAGFAVMAAGSAFAALVIWLGGWRRPG